MKSEDDVNSEKKWNTIHIDAGRNGQGYDVRIGAGLLDQAGVLCGEVLRAERVALITDSTVGALYAPTVEKSLRAAGFSVSRFTFPAGESRKTLTTVSSALSFLSDCRLTRKDAVIALGGGVVGDLAGFVAAVYLRGIDFIQIPTTLLAAVDSSVGGKTGVDLPGGKNLVGAFWQPSLVLYDTDTFATLDHDLILDGTAEIIKTAAIRDPEFFAFIETHEIADHVDSIVARCVRIKGSVVEADERESGLRKILNFGHTMAHAIELASDYTISHGKAVADGMNLITAASERHGLTPPGTAERIGTLIAEKGFVRTTETPLEELCRLAGTDKKTQGNRISLVYLEDIGRAATTDVLLKDLYEFMK